MNIIIKRELDDPIHFLPDPSEIHLLIASILWNSPLLVSKLRIIINMLTIEPEPFRHSGESGLLVRH